jgi:hypothetical protein
MKENEMFFEEFGSEIELAAQEWGVKEGLRLFGFTEFYSVSKAMAETPALRCYFIDPGYKVLTMLYFTPKEIKGKIMLVKEKTDRLDGGKERPACALYK